MDYYSQGSAVLFSQPFSQLLGAELIDLSKGKAELSLPIREDLKQSYGYVHGGVVGYLADNTLTFAAATILGHCVTSEYKINYLQPSIGEKLYATASVISFTLRQAVCECKVYCMNDKERQMVAAAQGTIVKIESQVDMKY